MPKAPRRWRSAGAPDGRRARCGGGAAAALAGCTSQRVGRFLEPGTSRAAPVPQVQAQPLTGPTVGETVGTGPVKVGLILPLTQSGSPSAVGASMRNAAQLAIEESGMNDVTMMIVDDHGTPDGAAQAAQAVDRRRRGDHLGAVVRRRRA